MFIDVTENLRHGLDRAVPPLRGRRGQARRVHDEHAALRLAAKRLESEEVTVDDLRELGIVLERHVRYEERELFPAIERDLSEEDLNALGEALERAGS